MPGSEEQGVVRRTVGSWCGELLATAMCVVALALAAAGAAPAADIGANDDTGKYAADSGSVFFPQMAALGLKQSVMTTRFLPSEPDDDPGRRRARPRDSDRELAGPRGRPRGLPVSAARDRGRNRDAGRVRGLAHARRRGYPTVRQFVVMNEPNQPAFMRPQFRPDGTNASAARAGAFLAAGYDALKAVDPTIRVVGLGLSPRGNDNPAATSNVSTSPVRFLAALGAWYRGSGRTRPLMDGLSFHPYPNQATDPLDSGYEWPNAGFVDLDRIKQAVWDAFRGTPQPTTVNGLRFYLDEVGWQVDTAGLPGYSGIENVPVTDETIAGEIYARSCRAAACDPSRGAELLRLLRRCRAGLGFQSALHRVDGTPRASAASVRSDRGDGDGLCPAGGAWYPAKRVVGAVTPSWRIEARRMIRVDNRGGRRCRSRRLPAPRARWWRAASALMADARRRAPAASAGRRSHDAPVRLTLRRERPLVPATAAIRLVAETSSLRSRTFSRPLP